MKEIKIRSLVSKIKHFPNYTKNHLIISYLKNKDSFNNIHIRTKKHPQIVVSLTSYKKRFDTLDICLKSIFLQTMLPDRLILYLSENESYTDLPQKIRNLQNYGLEIKFVKGDLRPHKKYYYAMKEFPEDIVITIDDDVIYDKNLIRDLWESHLKFKDCIIATRAHQMTFDEKGKLQSYKKWNLLSTLEDTPRMDLVATGVGGVLYPPHLLNELLLNDMKKISEYIDVDDLWLKNVELNSNIPTVICKEGSILEKHRIDIPNTQITALFNKNVIKNNNDRALKKLDEQYDFSRKVLHSINKN